MRVAIHRLDENGLTDLRRRKIGFIFQFFNLLPTLTVEENVRLPGLLQKVSGVELAERSAKLLESVGLASRAQHRLHQLSGGEMQRAALARALLLRPAGPVGGRTDRQSRFRGKRGGREALPPDRRDARHDHHHGDAQPRSSRERASHDHDARRARGKFKVLRFFCGAR